MQTFSGVRFQPGKALPADKFLLPEDILDETRIRMVGLRGKEFRLLWVQNFCALFGYPVLQSEGLWYRGDWESQITLLLEHALRYVQGT